MSQWNFVPDMGKTWGIYGSPGYFVSLQKRGFLREPHKNVVCRFPPRPQRMVKQNGRQIVQGSMSLNCRYSRNRSDERLKKFPGHESWRLVFYAKIAIFTKTINPSFSKMVPIDSECRFYPNQVYRMCINVNKLENRQKKPNVQTPSGPPRFNALHFYEWINPWNMHLYRFVLSGSSWNKHFFDLHLFWNDNKIHAFVSSVTYDLCISQNTNPFPVIID